MRRVPELGEEQRPGVGIAQRICATEPRIVQEDIVRETPNDGLDTMFAAGIHEDRWDVSKARECAILTRLKLLLVGIGQASVRVDRRAPD